MSTLTRALSLKLHGRPVATISRKGSSPEYPIFTLIFEETYVQMLERPVLSLKCLDWRLDRARDFHKQLPPFLSNLLPERNGALRRRIARTASFDDSDDFSLLEYVGQDMAGAITAETILTSHEGRRTVVETPTPNARPILEQPLRLSGGLAGIQLKFSVDRKERLSLPTHGRGGRWILKVPDALHPGLARAEYAAMLWAKAVGFEVPTVEIVDPHEVEGLPLDAIQGISEALLVQRFDRTEDYTPVHMEEFCSVLNLQPEDKYQDGTQPISLRMLAKMVKRVAGTESVRTFFKRILFDILVGNGDAHLKNWAFIYPDQRHPVLAPAYDIVPTVLYPYDHKLALAWTQDKSHQVKDFREIDARRIRQFAREIDEDPEEFIDIAQSLVRRAQASFHDVMATAQLPAAQTTVIEEHWQSLTLPK